MFGLTCRVGAHISCCDHDTILYPTKRMVPCFDETGKIILNKLYNTSCKIVGCITYLSTALYNVRTIQMAKTIIPDPTHFLLVQCLRGVLCASRVREVSLQIIHKGPLGKHNNQGGRLVPRQ